MDIKSTVREICQLNYPDKKEFLVRFLNTHQIPYSLYPYSYGTNLAVVIKGRQPENEILFFAHYDVFHPSIEGANDNASSVAVLLYAASALSNTPLEYTVKIVFNDNEEILGGIYGKKNTAEQINRIIENVGSYQYLKTIPHRKIIAAFVLELSGIGDSLYTAESSAGIKSHPQINTFLSELAAKNGNKLLNIPIAASDLISLHLTGHPGTVLGAIPYIEGINYLADIKLTGNSKNIYPPVWKKTHTSLDKYFSIQEKSLNMVYQFILAITEHLPKQTIESSY